jgi:hypothetical protein
MLAVPLAVAAVLAAALAALLAAALVEDVDDVDDEQPASTPTPRRAIEVTVTTRRMVMVRCSL